jgi:hypothetical protein
LRWNSKWTRWTRCRERTGDNCRKFLLQSTSAQQIKSQLQPSPHLRPLGLPSQLFFQQK